ncbi:MAG: thioredoxin family protein, partial [Kiloniellaceae bacterium]
MLRRLLLVLAFCLPASPGWAVTIGDDGLHKQDWFTISFRDIKEDIESAAEEGKRLAIIIEQRGCIYCQKVHEEILTDPEVRDYIKANYRMIQYNLYGDEEVTDLDGEVLTEKTAARKWGIAFTPTILFFPENVSGDLDARQAAVASMPGAFQKGTFLDMFTWVREKLYDTDEDFQRYHARRIQERRAAG